jgi:hypothetical protein
MTYVIAWEKQIYIILIYLNYKLGVIVNTNTFQ